MATPQSFVISVYIRPRCYRNIQISGENTLHQLSSVILDSFDFMDDHNHAFFMDDEPWSDQNCYYRYGDENNRQSTAEVTLNQVGLTEGQNFLYIFDFGDEWQFECRVLHILNENTRRPIILEAHGTPPEQYGDPEDDYEEEGNEMPIKYNN
ncbi:hypothetical protein M9Y10_003112 [Tritrichomonas musculus]|uniref:Plasmid pRiA4b Orf3-like domain-containing protein n=1 Tax=Tritrichomonas musculus TaxID=1915356 RepID=A0ABR2JPA9_9EUKA